MPRRNCGWCGTFANLTAFSEITRQRPQRPLVDISTRAYTCDYCGGINVGTVAQQRTPNTPKPEILLEQGEGTWHPQHVGRADQYDEAVPQHIAEAALEAHVCRDVDAFRGSISLARAAVEATAKERGIVSGRLVDKIDELYERGLVREYVKDAAHEIRYLGNEMAHGDFVEPVSAEESDEILTLMDEVLNEVYESPARVQRRRAARDAKTTEVANTED